MASRCFVPIRGAQEIARAIGPVTARATGPGIVPVIAAEIVRAIGQLLAIEPKAAVTVPRAVATGLRVAGIAPREVAATAPRVVEIAPSLPPSLPIVAAAAPRGQAAVVVAAEQ